MRNLPPVVWIERKLERYDAHLLHRIAVALAAAAILPPLAFLLEWKFQHVLHNLALIALTPIFGTSAKIVMAAATAKHRNWRMIGFTILLLSSATLSCLALAKLAGVKIAL